MDRSQPTDGRAATTSAGVAGGLLLGLCCGGALLAAFLGWSAVAAFLVDPRLLVPVVAVGAASTYWWVSRRRASCPVPEGEAGR